MVLRSSSPAFASNVKMTQKRESERERVDLLLWQYLDHECSGKNGSRSFVMNLLPESKVRRGGEEQQQQQLNPDEQREVLNKPQQISYLSGRRRGG